MTLRELVFVLVVLSLGFFRGQGTCPDHCKGGETCDDVDSGCPECEREYYGRQCEYRTECRYTNLGQEYMGKRNTTKSGLTCQRWDTQTPHSHGKKEEENYCRNPDKDPVGPWCYTVDPNTRYLACGVPMCDTQCPRPTLYLYGDVINPPTGGFAVDFTVEDVSGGCGIGKRGFRTCQKDLKWSSAFDCIDIPWCSKPVLTDPNSLSADRTDYYFNESVTSLCREGFEIVGNQEILCQANKTWTKVSNCTRVICSKPVLNDHSVIRDGHTIQTYVYEDEITVECTSGYETNQQTNFKCQANRNWNGSMPKCNAVHCENPVLNENSVILHRKPTYVYQDTVNITCFDGYNLFGERLFTCRADKTWSGAFPTCKPVPCQKPNLPQNSNTTLNNTFVFMDTVYIECIRGFTVKTNSVITCLANMTWGTIPECTIVVCDTPPLPAKASIIKGENTTYQHRHQLTLGCQKGYKYEGSGTITCLYTGLWEESGGQCVSASSILGTALGGTFGVLTVTAITGVIVFVLARRRKRNQNDQLIASFKHGKEIVDTGSTEENGVGVYQSDVRFDIAPDTSEDDIYINTNTDTTAGVIQIAKLTEVFSSGMAEETCFEKEFSELINGLQRPCKEACKQKNRPKNKYKNIYPYDDNRISLKKVAGLPESDFINASPIKGYEGETTYVAAQGPSHVTVDDFWRMIWELDSGQIVMLTNLEEDGRRKCERYWPEENAIRSGDIIIELLDVKEYSDFVIRHLDISKDKFKRKIYHFQFTSWPEDHLPDCASTVSFFRTKVISAPYDAEGPTIVHGSAGIGRTGVFIAFDYLMKEAEATKSVNVFNCVQRLREQRVQMVRTREQYEFIYRLLIEEFEFEKSTVAASDFSEEFERLKTRNVATGNTFLQDQFNILMKTHTVHVQQEDFKDGNISINQSKNRYADILPVDKFRPRLSGKGDDTGIYINAVFLPSFRKQKAYLVTQMPLPNTVEDFWSLVYEQDVAIIVMLNRRDDRSCGIYWPKDTKGQVQFGPFSVSLIQAEQNGNIITKTMKLEKEGVWEISRTVQQYQITDWPDNKCVPTVESFLKVVDIVMTALKDKDQSPVVVHCMNGAEKSGLFCTIMTVLERLLMQDDVAIIPIIKHMRSRRPQIIPNVEQFRFCHEVARQRVFGIYSNMNFEAN